MTTNVRPMSSNYVTGPAQYENVGQTHFNLNQLECVGDKLKCQDTMTEHS